MYEFGTDLGNVRPCFPGRVQSFQPRLHGSVDLELSVHNVSEYLPTSGFVDAREK